MSSMQHFQPRHTHRLTRLGSHFLFVGAFAMLGGALRGFNLLLMFAGLLVGALLVQWRWAGRSTAAVSMLRRLPSEAFAGESFRVRFRLGNQSRFLPAWMMRIEDTIRRNGGGDKATAICAVGVISPRETVFQHYDCTVTRRGKYRFGPTILSTTFPFSLLTSRRIVDAEADLCVYPRIFSLRNRWQQKLLSQSGGMTVTARRSGPTEGDFFGLREWQPGDSPKWIHWRTTARLGKLAVRQFEQQRRFDACILVDGYSAASVESEKQEGGVETAISLAASFLVFLVGSPSNRVVLAGGGASADAVAGSGSREGRHRMLAMLAELSPNANPLTTDAVEKAMRIDGPTRDLIVISPRSLKRATADNDALAAMIQPWIRRGAMRWINVSSSELDRWVLTKSSMNANQNSRVGVPARSVSPANSDSAQVHHAE